MVFWYICIMQCRKALMFNYKIQGIMEEIKVIYNGNLKTTATLGKSKITLNTDNSAEARAEGGAYTPVDMFVTSLGACMLSIMGMTAFKRGVDITGAGVAMTYESDEATHRVTAIKATFSFPGMTFSDAEKRILSAAARACPVGASLDPAINKELVFEF